ncbi:hypothetical protein [Halorubrum halophilum]|uniref:hypothetical protein n=1 Tax=Halorubrum halophilum TaxID=413816 RepID=UPI000679B3AB|nr:hypothetical protein [Halorubrum halophilum]
MRLTRRRALLGLVGASSAGGLGVHELLDRTTTDGPLSDAGMDGLLTVADVVHPAAREDVEPVISAYVGRLNQDRIRGVVRALSELDSRSRRHFGSSFGGLSRAQGERLLATLGVNRVQSRPEGTLAERARYHLVNSVLYALLTRPVGTEPFGIGNPIGFPGGFASHTGEP